MYLCNDVITVYNAKLDKEKGSDVYYGTVISGISWYCEIASTVDSTGLKSANKVTIRIPETADFGGKAYADPIAYKESEDVSGLFTLHPGDIIVHGASEPEGMTPSALKKAYAEVITVLGVTDNRRAPRAKHWKVVGT